MDRSTDDADFLAMVHAWLRERGELLVLRRYSRAAGSKDWYLVRSDEQLKASLAGSPDTSIIVMRSPQLPVRGRADRALADKACTVFPDGEWLFILRLQPHEQFGWSVHDMVEAHAELRERLLEEDMQGYEVAIGLEPEWLRDSGDVQEAIVSRSDGTVVRGVY